MMTIKDREDELARLHLFYRSMDLPRGPITIAGFLTIHDPVFFVHSCLDGAETGKGNLWHEGNLHRLKLFEEYLLTHQHS